MLMPDDPALITLVLITLLAATVNGALGYGFSSITVPVALLFYTNRFLNPVLVLVEVALNGYTLFLNRKSLPIVWKRVFPIVIGLIPGIVAGSYFLSRVHPGWVKLFTYAVLLPLILLQAAGIRRPIRAERAVGIPFGVGVGVLYSVTTISGPPLALLLNNQGYVKQEFRAALSLIRLAESTLTAMAYTILGLYQTANRELLFAIGPSILIGIPLGTALIRRIPAETFRRVCMSFDAWVVGFGLSRVLMDLGLLAGPPAYGVWLAVVLIDGSLLYRFFTAPRRGVPLSPSAGEVFKKEGSQPMGDRSRPQGFTVWFTGLPSSGKSTLAVLLRERLGEMGYPVELLDGDEVRQRLTRGLGFSKEDRDENIRRISYVAKLLTRVGAVAIVSAISPYRAVREEARAEIGNFVEVYVSCALEECIRRDVKGLYRKALRGEIQNFTGISDPYEPPLAPEVVVHTDRETPEKSLQRILTTLRALGYVPEEPEQLPPEEKAQILARLRSLGYLE